MGAWHTALVADCLQEHIDGLARRFMGMGVHVQGTSDIVFICTLNAFSSKSRNAALEALAYEMW